MKKTYRIFLLALCLTMLATSFTACSPNAPESPGSAAPSSSAAPGSSQAAPASSAAPAAPDKITEITHLMWDRGTLPASQGSLDKNWWIDYVNERAAAFGVKVNYIAIPFAQETQLLSTMLAANNAPDISKTSNDPLLKTYITNGGVADITGYVDQSGENIKALLGEERLSEISIGGKLYFIPHLQNGITGRTTWMRKDWLDAVGLPVPSTPEEFHTALKAIKEKDPGKAGAALIPFGMMRQNYAAWSNVVLPGFVSEPATPEKLLVPFPMWDETKEAMRYLNTLTNEGLLTEEFIIDKDDSMFKQKIARGEMFSFVAAGHYPYHSAYGSLYDKLRETQPEAELVSVNTFRQSADAPRIEYWDKNPVYQYKFFVPASSKNVELAVKLLNFLSSEEVYMTGGLGIEGEDYTLVNKVVAPVNPEQYKERIPWIEPQYGLMAKPYPRPEDKELFLENYIKDFSPAYHDQIRREANFLVESKYYTPTLSLPTPVSDKVSSVIGSFWDDEIAKIITAPTADFDKTFDAVIAEYKALGGDAKLEEVLRIYKEQTGK